ncbi:MAG TPA: hypothetical protein VLN49_16555 [Gemmatimonadaceae bacterium]|nr:hypothetical protein [Gemmatimonadaceae bacterium]
MSPDSRTLGALGLGLIAVLASSTHAQDVRNTSYTLASGERILRQEGELQAPLDTCGPFIGCNRSTIRAPGSPYR